MEVLRSFLQRSNRKGRLICRPFASNLSKSSTALYFLLMLFHIFVGNYHLSFSDLAIKLLAAPKPKYYLRHQSNSLFLLSTHPCPSPPSFNLHNAVCSCHYNLLSKIWEQVCSRFWEMFTYVIICTLIRIDLILRCLMLLLFFQGFPDLDLFYHSHSSTGRYC